MANSNLNGHPINIEDKQLQDGSITLDILDKVEKPIKDVPISLEDALEKIGVGYFNYKLTIIGGISLLSSYLAVGVMAFVLPSAQCDLQMTSEEKGRLASASFAGIILTCHLWGFLSDTLGRKYIIVRCLLFDGLLYLITMLVNNNNVMLVLRLFNGVASCGGVVSIYAYIGEFQPNKFRPRSIMIASLVASTAYILLPTVAWITIPAKWKFELYTGMFIRSWRLYYVLCGVPSIITAILIMFMPESPKFLLAKGKNKEVLKVLERMHYANNKGDTEFTIREILVNESEKVKTLGDDKNKAVAFFKLVWDQTLPLFQRPHVKNLALISISLFSVFACNSGIYIWLPDSLNRLELYKHETRLTGATYCTIVQYGRNSVAEKHSNMSTIEDLKAQLNETTSLLASTENVGSCNDDVNENVYYTFSILGTSQFVSWIVMVLVAKYCNKKYLVVILSGIVLLSVISLKFSSPLYLFAIKAAWVIVSTGITFPVLNGIVVDLFPTNLRAMAGCLTLMASRFGTLSVYVISGMLIDKQCELLLWLLIGVITVSGLTIVLLPSKLESNAPNTVHVEKVQQTSKAA